MTMKAATATGLLLAATLPLGCTDGPTPPKAEGLEFTVEPPSVAVGSPLSPAPVVVARDEDGNVAVDWKDSLTLTLTGGDPGAELAGTTTRAPMAGTFVFDDLEVTAPGEEFSFTARSGTLSEAQSASFDVHARLSSVQVVTFASHTCALSPEGQAFCWGSNSRGQLGDGTTETRDRPVRVGTEVRFAALSAGWSHTCGLATTGGVYCWGDNTLGSLGLGLPDEAYPLPASVPLPGPAITVDAGGLHTCALLEGGEVYCWGDNATGQIGVGVVGGEYSLPTPITGGHRFKTVSAGYVHTCGLTTSGAAYCWGGNRSGELGQGIDGGHDAEPIPSPSPVVGSHVFQTVVADGDYCCSRSCGRDRDGVWHCWGRTFYQYPMYWNAPTQVPDDPGFEEVTPGGFRLCGILGDGTLYGRSLSGGGIVGPDYSARTLTQLPPGLSVTSVAVGFHHICVSTSDQGTYCWGSNELGQIGNPSNPSGWYVPVPVWAPSG